VQGGLHVRSRVQLLRREPVDGHPHAWAARRHVRIPPTFDPTIDAAADFPGPGTFGITGTMQVQ